MKLCRKTGIGWQGLGHDLSKYGLTELKTGAKYYSGDRSPNAAERREKGYSEAWMHHKGRNRHHYEYWYDFSAEHGKYMPVPMPLNYLLESFCDRIAASKVYYGADYTDEVPLRYFIDKNDAAGMHPESAAVLERWLRLLAEKGESAALAQIRAEYRETKKAAHDKKSVADAKEAKK